MYTINLPQLFQYRLDVADCFVSNAVSQAPLSNNTLFPCAQWCSTQQMTGTLTIAPCFQQQEQHFTNNNFSTTARTLNLQELFRYLSVS